MGTVYEAHDPTLARQVAIKVVSVPGTLGKESPRSQRLLREAQALARLSHPNVVGVYDAGDFELGVFLAMELVAGESLASWLRRERRPWREVLPVFVAAGRGLEAAHNVGILHRDFKPQNVVLGDDGQPRVLDFGLARASDDVAQESDESAPLSVDAGPVASIPDGEALAAFASDDVTRSATGALSRVITQTGTVMGTPRYMAPEQHRGQAATESSDQFSFCVALYEAIYGRGALGGATGWALAKELAKGDVEGANDAGVPRHVRRAVIRGLSLEPEARFGSMSELLAELERDPAARRRRVAGTLALAATAAAIGAAALGLIGGPGEAAALCRPPDDSLAGVWGPQERAAVERAFTATGKDYATGLFTRTDAALADYRQRWLTSYTEACKATHVRGEQSPARLDRRMACLRRNRDRMGAFVNVLARPDGGDAMNRALGAIDKLGYLAPCSDDGELSSLQPPKDPAVAAAAEAVARQLDRAEALELAGAYSEALDVATTARERATELGVQKLEASGWLRIGSLQDRSGEWPTAIESLERAAKLAALAGDSRALAQAQLQTLWVVGYRQKQFDVAQRLRGPVEISVHQAGSPPQLQQQLLNDLGMLAFEANDFARARRHFDEFRAFVVEHFGPDSKLVGSALNNIALTHQHEGNLKAAERLFRQVVDLERESIGFEHPWAAHTRNNLAETLRGLGRFAEAEAMLRPSLDIYADAYGKQSPRYAGVVRGLAVSIAGQGERAEQAEELLLASLQIFTQALGEDHAHSADTRGQLGAFYLELGRLDDAALHYQAAIRSLGSQTGQERWLGEARLGLARVERARGDLQAAESELDAAQGLFEASVGLEHSLAAEVATERGRCALVRGQLDQARRLLEPAVAQLAAAPSGSAALANARFALAQVLAASAIDAERARALALQSRQWHGQEGRNTPRVAKIDRWLAGNPR